MNKTITVTRVNSILWKRLILFCGFIFLYLSLLSVSSKAQCVDCGNAYLNISNTNAIEYDGIVNLFHSTMARQANGKVLVWGEHSKSDGMSSNLLPSELTASNYPGLSGQVLKFAGGSSNQNKVQFAVLTTDGLFIWGDEGVLVSSAFKAGTAFQKINNGLPAGIMPTDVKMLFGTYQTLAILTCTGQVWVLSQNADMRGNGSTGNTTTWYKVTEATSGNPAISNVIAVRGCPSALVAQKSDGTVWTWGINTYLGNNTDASAGNTRATSMTLNTPQGTITPKMIGMAGFRDDINNYYYTSYYILGTNGFVFSLGANFMRQLGNRTIDDQFTWVRAKAGASTDLNNIAWISPNEHDNAGKFSVNALTSSGALWAWGSNERNMLGLPDGGVNGIYDPTSSLGGLNAGDVINAVETGGHTTIVIKKCSGRFGYVGHRVNGSMADGTSTNASEPIYNFSATSVMDICAASSGAATLFPVQGTVRTNNPVQLHYAPLGGSFSIISGPASVTPNGQLTVTATNANVQVRYSFSGECGPTTSDIIIKSSDIVLPVVFDKISARYANENLCIDFAVAAEKNNSHFDIEASKEGVNFVKIGSLPSLAKDGNSDALINYQFCVKDANVAFMFALFPLAFLTFLVRNRKATLLLFLLTVISIIVFNSCKKDQNGPVNYTTDIFVRIKQVDKDGSYQYSKVVKVEHSK